MLREFLSKIFSPPKPVEEPRVQQEDFARLKKRIHEDENEPEEVCEVPHGRLSQQFSQHVPLTRSVSMGASNSAYERYLQRNAAKADNWAAFDDILNPKIDPLDAPAQPASFLTSEEESELEAHQEQAIAQPIKPFLKPQQSNGADKFLSASLVYLVEMTILKNAQKQLLNGSKSKIKIATLETFNAKPRRSLSPQLSQRIMTAWLKNYAGMETTPADALRAMSSSSMPAVRASVASNERIPFDCLWALAHDTTAPVRLRLARNPNCTIELLETLSKDESPEVAQNARKILTSITG